LQGGRSGFLPWFADAVAEDLLRGSALYAAALERSPGVVACQVVVEHRRHPVDGCEPGAAAVDAEGLVVRGAVEKCSTLPFDCGRLTRVSPWSGPSNRGNTSQGCRSSRPKTARPLSVRPASTEAPSVSKGGRTPLFISCMAMSDSLFGQSRARA
jgi:hypothetical protein